VKRQPGVVVAPSGTQGPENAGVDVAPPVTGQGPLHGQPGDLVPEPQPRAVVGQQPGPEQLIHGRWRGRRDRRHTAGLNVQGKYEVRYLRYWVDEAQGKVFCLAEAPSADAAATVHREAHGLMADEIYQVQEGS
jgi:hypothetical protein